MHTAPTRDFDRSYRRLQIIVAIGIGGCGSCVFNDALLNDGAAYGEAEGRLLGTGQRRRRRGGVCVISGGGCGDEALEDFVLKAEGILLGISDSRYLVKALSIDIQLSASSSC